MWATPYASAFNASPTATLRMNHALSVIRFSLSKGDYTGTGNITSITIKGDCMAKTGTLNAKDGTVTPTDGGTEIDMNATATLTNETQTVEQLVIPTSTSGNISVTIQLNGNTFEATSSAPITLEKSKAYNFGLTFNDSKLTMSTVSIGTIDEVDKGNMTPVIRYVPTTITWAEAKAADGVYGIYDGKPALYSEASVTTETLSGVAIVMYGRALQISNSQPSLQTWGSTSNISGIPDVTKTGGGVTSSQGFLPQADGSYGTSTESQKIKEGYENWLSYSSTALADTAGWSNTEALITAHSGLTPSRSYIGAATADFRNGANNQGYSDWFVPSCGQLAYIHLNQDKINTLLPKCGGKPLPTSGYWSSSESSSGYAWEMSFSNGQLNTFHKSNSNYVRFCRYITE